MGIHFWDFLLRYELKRMQLWTEMKAELDEKFSNDPDVSRLNSSRPRVISQFGGDDGGGNNAADDDFLDASNNPGIVLGHPKLEKLRDLVLEHFR